MAATRRRIAGVAARRSARQAGSSRPVFRATVPVILTALSVAGCGDLEPPAPSEAPPESPVQRVSDTQTAFRIRTDFEAGLNSDRGWAAAPDRSAAVTADRPFRLRFEAAAGDAPAARRYRLQVRRNGGDWQALPAEDFPYPLKVHELKPDPAKSGTVDRSWRFERGASSAMRRSVEGDPAHWRIETGARPLLAFGRYEIDWQPNEFTAELRLPDNPRGRAALVFEHGERGDVLAVQVIRPATVRLVRIDGARIALLAERRFELAVDRWFEVNVVVEGSQATVEIGDEALVFSQPLPGPVSSPRIGIHVPAESVADVRSLTAETEAQTPRTSIVAGAGFEHGAPTTDLLPVSDRPFTGGAGISLAERTPPWSADGGHGEWEFPVVIRRFADEAALNDAGDRFDYRLVTAGGEPLAGGKTASVRLEVPDGHLGGTFVETPMRLGPWQASNGDLYFIMEPSETWNRLMMVKSSDGGRTWREVDGARRPETGDLEGLGSVMIDDRIHILHQVSEAVLYHAFDTSDRRGEPDTWAVRDERVAAPPQPPTQVADLAVRADGSIVAVYGSAEGVRVSTRAPDGGWSETSRIDGPEGTVASGPTVVVDDADTVHLAYTAGGRAWYRRIAADGSLTDAVEIADGLADGEEDVGAILPLLHLPGSDSVAVVYRAADGRLRERRVDAGGSWTRPVVGAERTVVQNAVDSDQAGADAVVHGETIHVLFVDEETGHLFHASGRAGDWRDAEAMVTDANVQWVRGAVVESPAGEPVYGFVYDAGSNGGSGMNKYRQVPLTDR